MMRKGIGNERAKRIFCLLAMACVCAAAFCADAEIGELSSAAENVYSFFRATWLKAVCGVAMTIEAIVFIVSDNKGNVAKKLLPVVVGEIILLNASAIVDFFWQS